MDENNQIEEMANCLCREYETDRCNPDCGAHGHCNIYFDCKVLYEAGYRKQVEGEWLNGVNGSKVCSMCGKEPLYTKSGTVFATTFYRVKSNFCPECGAKMKGEGQ